MYEFKTEMFMLLKYQSGQPVGICRMQENTGSRAWSQNPLGCFIMSSICWEGGWLPPPPPKEPHPLLSTF